MPARYRFWIMTIIALFIGSFLVGFAPVRRPDTGGFAVQSKFRYEFAQPVATEQEAARAAKVQELVEAAGITMMEDVRMVDSAVVEVYTAAPTDEQARSHEQLVTRTLQENFEGISGPQAPPDARTERPLWQLLDFMAVYPPRPQIKLGLDLQGGAHVVLRCLPQATMYFASPEDKPLVKPDKSAEAEEDAGETTSGYEPPETRTSLVDRVKATLARAGVPAQDEHGNERIDVQVPSPYLLVVRTRANDETTAEKHQKIVEDFLNANYPGVVIEVREMETVFVGSQTAAKVKNIVDRRLYQMSDIREPVIQQQGSDQIIVELPGVRDPDRVTKILRSTAQLEFRLIPPRYSLPEGAAARDDYSQWTDQTSGEIVAWERVYNDAELAFSGADLKSNARVVPGQAMDFVVSFEMRDEKKTPFYDFTRRNVKKIMAIVLDQECQMGPVIQSAISGGRGEITGNFKAQEAGDLALLLNAGALPVPLEIAENRTVSATLGQDTIHRSLIAGGIAFGCVILFMIGFYRLPGVLAGVALILYVLLLLAVLVVVGATLTLPGVAGLILSIGFAVDANVIVFERLKEELWGGRTMRSAVEAGFDRAWTAILDANVTTLIVAAVLYFLGTSLIKSFAVVLFLGICVSLFTTVTVTRWLITIVGRTSLSQNLALYGVAPRQEK